MYKCGALNTVEIQNNVKQQNTENIPNFVIENLNYSFYQLLSPFPNDYGQCQDSQNFCVKLLIELPSFAREIGVDDQKLRTFCACLYNFYKVIQLLCIVQLYIRLLHMPRFSGINYPGRSNRPDRQRVFFHMIACNFNDHTAHCLSSEAFP